MRYGLNIKGISIEFSHVLTKVTLVVLFNGFQKKSQKTPTGEIEKTLKIKTEYFIEKIKSKGHGNKR